MTLLLLAACRTPSPEPPPRPAPEARADATTPEPLAVTRDADISGLDPEARRAFLLELGQTVYETGDGGIACVTCHQPDGQGIRGAFPPLVGQREWMGDCTNHARIVLGGLRGPIEVDGVRYNGVMVGQAEQLNDLQVAAVTSYVRNRWGNDYGFCSPTDAAAARAALQEE